MYFIRNSLTRAVGAKRCTPTIAQLQASRTARRRTFATLPNEPADSRGTPYWWVLITMPSADLQFHWVDNLIMCPGYMGWLLSELEVFSISGERETRKRRRMLRRRVPNIVGQRRSMRERQRLIGEFLFFAGLKIARGERGWMQG